MARDVDIQIDPRQLERLRKTLRAIPRGLPKVVTRAINRTASRARTKIVRAVAAGSGLMQKDIRRATRLRRATYTRWIATLRIFRKRVPLISQGARQIASGVSYRGPEGRSVAAQAFIATMPSGHTGVFRREGSSRLPIRELFATPALETFQDLPQLSAAVLDAEIAAGLARELDTQLAVVLQRAAA